MPLTQKQLTQIVLNNPSIHMAFNTPHLGHDHFALLGNTDVERRFLKFPPGVNPSLLTMHFIPPLKTLELQLPDVGPSNEFQFCQDEPIRLGTQIQPQAARWIGTAGCPCAWIDPAGKDHWGILSNWHVFNGGFFPIGTPQHQPLDTRPPCAHLAAFIAVDPAAENICDIAFADARIGAYHSISWSILELGELAPGIAPAVVGRTYVKVGRTTGFTHARCSAVDVTVRVAYGDFDALFIHQDLFEDIDESFSAPGDSGSAIICTLSNGASSLLFAGGGTLTVGNPMKLVQDCFPIRFGK